MNQMITPEATHSSALEYVKMNDEDNAILIINDFILNSKKKHWTLNHEMIINLYIDLLIKKNKTKLLKDALNYYRNISQVNNIESFQSVIAKTKELVEEKLNKAQKSYHALKFEAFDLDSDHSPELLYNLDDQANIQEMSDLINSQKFIWETYKILLDFTKTNNKLLNLYSQILKSAFAFCKENKRKNEFKRLCDSVRGYLQTLIKTEKKTNFQNKVQISKPEVLKNLIQIRINLLDTATHLEQWQEAFKTAEDTIFLMDKYEKQNLENSSTNNVMTNKKNLRISKIPILMKLDFYSNIEKLLLISDYPLYHAYSTITIKDLNIKVQKTLKTTDGKIQSVRDLRQRLESIDIQKSFDNILLSALSTPYYNYYTNYLKIGEELYEHEKEIETETCSRMMSVLKLSVVPSRKNLINYIQENKISQNCSDTIQELFDLIENEKNPLKIANRGAKIIEGIREGNYRKNYLDSISKNIVIKVLDSLSKLYDSISFERLKCILKWVDSDELENTILENSRLGLISCSIDHENDMILFNIRKNIQNNLNEKFLNFLNSVEKIGTEIVLNDAKNRKKISNLRSIVLNELSSFNSTSLTLSDNLLATINQKTKQLNDYIRIRDQMKNELIEKKIRERNEAKEKAEKDARALKEILKDEQKQKEFDIQLKKFLIDRIKVFTNTFVVDGKKMRLDDVLKDLSKIKDETLIKVLENEEVEFKTKKEKKFKELSRDCDYQMREFRKRDLKRYLEILKVEEVEFNKMRNEEERKNYDEKIKFKANLNDIKPFKDNYFKEIEKTRESEFVEKFNDFKNKLNEKVREELLKEVGNHFKTYIDEFRKEEEDSRKKREMMGSTSFNKSTNLAFGKGGKFVRYEETTKTMEFNKGEKFTKSKDEPKLATTTTLEFKKGAKFEETQKPVTDTKIIKGAEAQEKPLTTGFVRGAKFQEEPKEPRKHEEPQMIQRGIKVAEDAPIIRGTKVEVKEEKKGDIKENAIIRGTKVDVKEEKKTEIKVNTMIRGTKAEIKEEKKTETKENTLIRGIKAEVKEEKKTSKETTFSTENTISKGGMIQRGKALETSSSANATPTSNPIQKGAISKDGKDDKSKQTTQTKPAESGSSWRKNK